MNRNGDMPESTRRQFLEGAGAAAAVAVLAPPALAAARSAPSRALRAPAPPVGPGAPFRHLPVRDLYRRDVRGRRADLHHEPFRPRGRRGEGAVRGRAPASARPRRVAPPPCAPIGERCERGGSSRGCSSTATSATLSTNVLGVDMPAPVILGPVGRQALAHPDGEAATARAAAGLDLTYVHSSRSASGRGRRRSRSRGLTVVRPGLAGRGRPRPHATPARAGRGVYPPRALTPAARAGLGGSRADPRCLERADRPQRDPDRAGCADGRPPRLRRHRRVE